MDTLVSCVFSLEVSRKTLFTFWSGDEWASGDGIAPGKLKIMVKFSKPWVFSQGFMVGIYGAYIDIYLFIYLFIFVYTHI